MMRSMIRQRMSLQQRSRIRVIMIDEAKGEAKDGATKETKEESTDEGSGQG